MDTTFPVAVPAEFAPGAVVRSTVPEFKDSMWDAPLTITRVRPSHPLHRPVFVKTAGGVVGAFHPSELEILL